MDELVSSSELAKVLKLSARRVNQLAEQNIVYRENNGKFNLADSCENFYAWKFRSDEKMDYDLEHALLEKAKREKAELDLQQHKKQLLVATDVEHMVSGMILTCKAHLLSIPSKIAPKLTKQANPAVIADKIQHEIYEALSELSQIPAERVIDSSDAVDS